MGTLLREETRWQSFIGEDGDGSDEGVGGQSQVMHGIFDQANVSDREENDFPSLEDSLFPLPIVPRRIMSVAAQMWDV
eukprot:CAMPEP_0194039354 /NCGR_PEP_ID=MMETSP0009_2-20130614/11497_1 /TAXON_ID=210454 /ORGANISM="Grammatophora oceanica, Strain CCMP 410" /LENGTH=77 /DNA_ID=CAMNT_0038682175 /DNA_START=813 /DNA_END=1046 /DNA_ORIENTATION=+